MIPTLGSKLTQDNIDFLKAFTTSCRRSVIQMVTNAQSGHPGGSMSSIDFLSILYTFILSQTGEKIVVSNGHISPAIYSVLAELEYIPKEKVINTFRKIESIYEGHVTRLVNGIWYGTGPLGVGVSVAAGFALSEKKKSNDKVFAVMGDGECDEGQVYEMMNFANKYKLNNLIVFLDGNAVQLSDSTQHILPIDIPQIFNAGGWKVIDVDGHDFNDLWYKLSTAYIETEKPILIVAHTIMGKGVSFMEAEGLAHKSTWHGSAPKPEVAQTALKELELSQSQIELINSFQNVKKWYPSNPSFIESLTANDIQVGTPIVYDNSALTDCRSAYGKALLDLAHLNEKILAMSADLKTSTMTKYVDEELPLQHIECGIAEQNMISVAGGLSLNGYIPFASTFGAFITSRAKDQVRVNDINRTNVKMVATHCGLSVGEDGPTHQSIDDSGSMLGLFNTMTIEPCDPNQTDRIIRYIASHYGNFYVRMGRHKFPVITHEDGTIFFDAAYSYTYGQTDLIRSGDHITIAASGATVNEALKAYDILKTNNISAQIISISSLKKLDDNFFENINRTHKLITVEDHNPYSGIGSQILKELTLKNISLEKVAMLGVYEYQLSGKAEELYARARIDANAIVNKVQELLHY